MIKKVQGDFQNDASHNWLEIVLFRSIHIHMERSVFLQGDIDLLVLSVTVELKH